MRSSVALIGESDLVRMDEHHLLCALGVPQVRHHPPAETQHLAGLLEAWVLAEAGEQLMKTGVEGIAFRDLLGPTLE